MPIETVRPTPAFSDQRGDITNLLAFPVQHVVLITSKPGAIRGNHVHETDSHFTFLLSGRCRYHQVKDGVKEECWLETGEMVFTPSGVPHALVFEKDSVFLAFCTAERMGGKYQEDTQKCTVVEVH